MVLRYLSHTLNPVLRTQVQGRDGEKTLGSQFWVKGTDILPLLETGRTECPQHYPRPFWLNNPLSVLVVKSYSYSSSTHQEWWTPVIPEPVCHYLVVRRLQTQNVYVYFCHSTRVVSDGDNSPSSTGIHSHRGSVTSLFSLGRIRIPSRDRPISWTGRDNWTRRERRKDGWRVRTKLNQKIGSCVPRSPGPGSTGRSM